MRRLLRYGHAVVFCLLALGITLPASAQDAPTVELSGGYNFLRVQFEDFEDEKSFPAGWYVDVASNVTEMIGIVGQIGGNYKTLFDTVDTSLHRFLGGVRVSSRTNQQVVPFVQVLAGGIRSSFEAFGESESQTDGALQIGGGVNLMPNDSVGIRVGADYLRVFDEDEGVNVFRFAVGVVLPF